MIERDGTMARPVAGIDIGGTKIAVLIVDADGAVLGRATRSSSAGDQDGAAEAIAACLDEALGGAGLARDDLGAVGVGVPGRVDPAAGPRDPRGQPRLARLRAPGRARDARSAARSSSRTTPAPRPSACTSAASSAALDDLAYLAVGTGIAAGVVLDGRSIAAPAASPARSATPSPSATGRAAPAASTAASRRSPPARRSPAAPAHATAQGGLRSAAAAGDAAATTSSMTSADGSPGRSTCWS